MLSPKLSMVVTQQLNQLECEHIIHLDKVQGHIWTFSPDHEDLDMVRRGGSEAAPTSAQ
jgi:hypothetical protein